MGINFERKLSQEDMNAANDILNPPQFEPGYGDGPSDQSFTDLFSDLDGGGEGLFGDLSGQSDGFGQSGGFGQSDGFGGQQGGFGQSGGFGHQEDLMVHPEASEVNQEDLEVHLEASEVWSLDKTA